MSDSFILATQDTENGENLSETAGIGGLSKISTQGHLSKLCSGKVAEHLGQQGPPPCRWWLRLEPLHVYRQACVDCLAFSAVCCERVLKAGQ